MSWSPHNRREAVQYFLEFVISSLVHYADEVVVEQTNSGNTIQFCVRLNPVDVGKVIGRKGRTISALRNILNAIAAADHKKVMIEILEPA
jgi:hypothetical protein